jgi:hypothetical protein
VVIWDVQVIFEGDALTLLMQFVKMSRVGEVMAS